MKHRRSEESTYHLGRSGRITVCHHQEECDATHGHYQTLEEAAIAAGEPPLTISHRPTTTTGH